MPKNNALSQSRVLAHAMDVAFFASIAFAIYAILYANATWEVVGVTWLAFILVGHLTNTSVSLYLHRACTHQPAVKFVHWLNGCFRAVTYMTTGIASFEWCAIHFRHHSENDSQGAVHSPKGGEGVICGTPDRSLPIQSWERWLTKILGGKCTEGFGVVFNNYRMYRAAAHETELVQKFLKFVDVPHDWFERHFVHDKRLRSMGIFLLLPIILTILGYLTYAVPGIIAGLILWPLILLWTIVSGGIINGVGHSAPEPSSLPHEGYSINILPWCITLNFLFCGENFHNGHHRRSTSWSFDPRDIGAFYIRVLQALGLAQARTI